METDFKLKINLKEERVYLPKEKVEGHISVTALQAIEVDILSYKLFLEIRGLTKTDVITLGEKVITRETPFSAGEVKNYPFALTNHKYETYKGKNVELLIRMEATLKLKDTPSQNFLLSKVGYIHSGSKKSMSKYLFFEYEKGSYKIVAKQIDLPQHLSTYWVTAISLTFIIGILFFSDYINSLRYKNIAIMLGGLIFLLATLYLVVENFFIGKIQAQLVDAGTGQFQVELKNNKKWESIKSITARYKILEEVVDRRGTSSSTETSYIHMSALKTVENPWRGATLVFEYPKKSIPIFHFEDVRTYWLLEIKVFSSVWVNFTYCHEILVEHRLPATLA